MVHGNSITYIPPPNPPILLLGPGGGPPGPPPRPALYVDAVLEPLLVRSGCIIVLKL